MGLMMPQGVKRPQVAPARRMAPPTLMFGIGAPKGRVNHLAQIKRSMSEGFA